MKNPDLNRNNFVPVIAPSESYPNNRIMIVGGRPEDSSRADQFHQDRHKSNHPSRKKRCHEGTADITLVNMNLLYVSYNDGIDHEIHPPLGLLYLISALEKKGHVVDFIDYQTFSLDQEGCDLFSVENVIHYFGEMSDIIGLSCMANLLPFTIMVAEKLKERYPEKTIILGGVGSFGVEELILDRFPWIDVIVRGEGEVTMTELQESFSNHHRFSGIPGISYRTANGKVVRNEDRKRIANLDSLAFPAYNRLTTDYYDAFNVITNRGCPFHCSFCSVAPVWGHSTTQRSHENIIDEIRYLHENYEVSQILFQDEFFYSSDAKIIDFCKKLIQSGLSITWKCFGRVNLVGQEAMGKMVEAGCVQIRFGVESASDTVLSKIVKSFRFSQALDVVTRAVQLFDSVETFFIWGFPFESMNDFLTSVTQMARFQQIGVNVLPSLLSMLPQTKIYHDYCQGKYSGELTLHHQLIPWVVVTGHEELGRENQVPEKYAAHYELIRNHPDIFPGFYLFNYEKNIKPKLNIMRKMGFM